MKDILMKNTKRYKIEKELTKGETNRKGMKEQNMATGINRKRNEDKKSGTVQQQYIQ